jgi:hypothetical protein
MALPDAVRGVAAAARLARGDARGIELLDLSVEGFWRSFQAVLWIMPLHAVILLAVTHTAAEADLPISWTGEYVSLLARFALSPLVALVLARLLGLGRRFVALVTASNWASVLQSAFLAVSFLLISLLPEEDRPTLQFVVFAMSLTYGWFVARSALATTGLMAFSFVLADIVTSLWIDQLLDRLLQLG